MALKSCGSSKCSTSLASSQVHPCIMPNRGRLSKAAAAGESPLQAALQPILQRVEILEAFVGDITPDNAQRTVDRCTELEATCRGHFNTVMTIAHNQRVALSQAAREAQERCDKALRSLEDATLRHTTEAAAMRAELGVLKQMLGQSADDLEATRASLQRDLGEVMEYAEGLREQCAQALEHGKHLTTQCDEALSQGLRLEEWREHCDAERQKCEAMLHEMRGWLQQARPGNEGDVLVQKAVFRAEQHGLVRRARSLSRSADPGRADLRSHLKHCQVLAASRSPTRCERDANAGLQQNRPDGVGL